MSGDGGGGRRVPLSVTAVTALCMAPALALPWLLAKCPPVSDYEWILRIYPFYVIVCGACAWLSWRERPWLTWTLLLVLCLSHMAVWVMALSPEMLG